MVNLSLLLSKILSGAQLLGQVTVMERHSAQDAAQDAFMSQLKSPTSVILLVAAGVFVLALLAVRSGRPKAGKKHFVPAKGAYDDEGEGEVVEVAEKKVGAGWWLLLVALAAVIIVEVFVVTRPALSGGALCERVAMK